MCAQGLAQLRHGQKPISTASGQDATSLALHFLICSMGTTRPTAWARGSSPGPGLPASGRSLGLQLLLTPCHGHRPYLGQITTTHQPLRGHRVFPHPLSLGPKNTPRGESLCPVLHLKPLRLRNLAYPLSPAPSMLGAEHGTSDSHTQSPPLPLHHSEPILSLPESF